MEDTNDIETLKDIKSDETGFALLRKPSAIKIISKYPKGTSPVVLEMCKMLQKLKLGGIWDVIYNPNNRTKFFR